MFKSLQKPSDQGVSTLGNLAMKQKISISLDEITIEKLKDFILDGSFRNKSHLIEFALIKFIMENKNGKEE